MNSTCTTCRWAKWHHRPNGKIDKKHAGDCTFQIMAPKLPLAIMDYSMPKPMGIWLHWPTGNCPCYEAVVDGAKTYA